MEKKYEREKYNRRLLAVTQPALRRYGIICWCRLRLNAKRRAELNNLFNLESKGVGISLKAGEK